MHVCRQMRITFYSKNEMPFVAATTKAVFNCYLFTKSSGACLAAPVSVRTSLCHSVSLQAPQSHQLRENDPFFDIASHHRTASAASAPS